MNYDKENHEQLSYEIHRRAAVKRERLLGAAPAMFDAVERLLFSSRNGERPDGISWSELQRVYQSAKGLDNSERIERSKAALRAMHEPPSIYLEQDIIDLIADLLHLANSERLDTDSIMRMAFNHFKEEI